MESTIPTDEGTDREAVDTLDKGDLAARKHRQLNDTGIQSANLRKLRQKTARGPISHVAVAGDSPFTYDIVRVLGEGGLGTVYLAKRGSDARMVALKLTSCLNDPVASALLRQEARILSGLDSPHIVQVLDAGDTVDGEPYLAMEYLNGHTLDRVMATERPLTAERAARICLQIAKALNCAHLAGVVHCDLKPANIFLTEKDGIEWVTLIDFGIATLLKDDGREKQELKCGSVLYMSPEQAQDASLTSRSDIFQIGLILFECLQGQLPFETSLRSALQYRVSGDAMPAVCEHVSCILPRRMKALLHKALAKDPRQRHQSISELIDELTECVPWSDVTVQ